jgi:hypothetical protein
VDFSLATDAPLAPLAPLYDRMVRFVYVQTKPDSFTRKFLVDLCAAGATIVDLTCNLPTQFLVDLAQKLLSRQPIGRTEIRQALAGYLGQGEEEEEAKEAEEEGDQGHRTKGREQKKMQITLRKDGCPTYVPLLMYRYSCQRSF